MDERDYEDLTPDIAGRLRELRRDVPPPSHFRTSLTERRSVWRWAAVAAVALVSFAAGRYTAAAPVQSEHGDRFVLFLYGGANSADSVQAHRLWARGLASRGQLISGVKLKQESNDVSGYFVFRARSAEEARTIAAECPHAKSGGRISLREVDPL